MKREEENLANVRTFDKVDDPVTESARDICSASSVAMVTSTEDQVPQACMYV